MLACPHLTWINLEDLLIHSWVVQETQGVVSHVHEAIKVVGVNAHAHRDGAHHLGVESLALAKKVGHGALEVDQLALFGRPLVRVAGFAITADLEAFFDVGHGAAYLFDLGDVGELGHLLAARGGVAAVGLGGGPAVGELGVDGETKKLGGGVEDVGARFGGDGDVAEIDEAGGLEPVEDGFGCLEFLGLVAVEEFPEVYEL